MTTALYYRERKPDDVKHKRDARSGCKYEKNTTRWSVDIWAAEMSKKTPSEVLDAYSRMVREQGDVSPAVLAAKAVIISRMV